MPFGSTNSPAVFQRLMDLVLGDAKDIFVVAYIEDVLLFSQTPEEQLEQVRITLERMHEAGLTVTGGKEQLTLSCVKLLGYVVDNGTVQPSDAKLKAVL